MNPTSVLIWKRAGDELPDDEIAVLIAFADGEIWTGYHEGDAWYYRSGDRCTAPVVWWADFPEPPSD